MPSISVIIPTYNYGRFLNEAISSVLKQTLRPSEIIVVDDGSTDETTDAVASLADKVRYVRQENSGVCAARNRGVAESTGSLIAFLDADDMWEPMFLETLSQEFRDRDVGLVHCGQREFDHKTGKTLRLHVGTRGSAENLLLWTSVNVTGSVLVVRREAFDAVGGFDPLMKVGEDWDFCYRVARQYEVGFVPEALAHYRSHSAAAHRNVAEMERGMTRFYEKAFRTADDSVLRLKSRAYGNFHKVLAGSYFHVGDYRNFAKHAAQSILTRPGNLGYFLRFPVRRFLSKKKGVNG